MGRTQSDNIKHAYLIMAHHDFGLVEKLLSAIDDERNDIYLHIDKKAKGYDVNQFKSIVTKSDFYLVKPMRVIWGDYSMVKCMIALLTQATCNGRYRYYHLLSGQDFPIRSQDYIHATFDNSDLEYITSWENMPEVNDARNYTDAYSYYYWVDSIKNRFTEYSRAYKLWTRVGNKVMVIERKLNVKRDHDATVTIYKGDQWFSITDAFARYVVENYRVLRKHLRFTMAPDELIIPTLAHISPFKDKIAYRNYRLIDWKRGDGRHPYCFRSDDYDEIIESSKLFVRKVSTYESGDLTEKLLAHIKSS